MLLGSLSIGQRMVFLVQAGRYLRKPPLQFLLVVQQFWLQIVESRRAAPVISSGPCPSSCALMLVDCPERVCGQAVQSEQRQEAGELAPLDAVVHRSRLARDDNHVEVHVFWQLGVNLIIWKRSRAAEIGGQETFQAVQCPEDTATILALKGCEACRRPMETELLTN